ncbi:hypothetical protein AVEN_47448-1 [Araneus ventricosus]|uniref:Uncharacterized protein n=1 Tax=Araneus ventricosus TaxID=182803 RepID=A0A4Y2ISR5_ARAVE|nr:hypothetical protein AVEN_47448-1 [Araneus ventricosus]
MTPMAVDGDLMLEDKVKFFKEKLNRLHDIFRRVSEKKSTNAQDKDEFSNYKADILMLYVEAVSSLVLEKNFESEEASSMMDLFIELKNEFAAFRKDIYSKVDSFSKLICPTDDTIQNEGPRPSLQREIIETELKSEISTYASVAQTSSAIPEGKFKVLGPVIKDKRVNPKVVINGARKNSGLKIVAKMPKRKAIFLSRLGPDTTLNDITNFLAPLNLNFLQCQRLKTKYQSYASFHIENVRGLRTKTVEFYSSVEYEVICVTGSWLCEDINSWHLFAKRYLVYRKDRGSSANSSRRGGGVLVAIKKCLSSVNWTFLACISKLSEYHLFYNNERYENDGDIANAFADYFSSVFKPSTDFDGNDECNSNCVGDLVKIESVTYDDVVLGIRELKYSLTVGVDNIPSFIIKGCAEFLIYPLLILLNLSLRTKVFPDVWKQTKIIPGFKKR